MCPELLQGMRRKSSLKQQRNCKHDDSQGILSLSMGNEPVSYKTDQLKVSPNKVMSKGFEIGLPTKMFQAYLSNRPAVLCFQDIGIERSGLKTGQSGKIWISSVMV